LAIGCAQKEKLPLSASAASAVGSSSTNSQFVIVCEPRYYIVRDGSSGNLRLHATTNHLSPFDVRGIVLEVLEPRAYSGMVCTVHHDSVFDPGDPLVGLALSNRYEFRARPGDIGRFRFGPCSIDRARQMPDEK
jgi:hypothetical protein